MAKKKKKLLLAAGAVGLTAALGVGIWFGTRGGGEPVNVYPFQYIGMTEFWGDNQESYGPVTTDKIQTVFLTDTQTVTEVKVKDGDSVKKGDVLFSFDTTLDSLTLERKRLEVEKIKVQIKAAEERLGETYNMTPYVPPKFPEQKEDLGEELKDQLYKISENPVYDGSKPETALICWMKDETPITDALLQELWDTAKKYQQENALKPKPEKQETSNASAEPERTGENPPEEEKKPEEKTIPMVLKFTGTDTQTQEDAAAIGEDGYKIVDAYTFQGKTYWLKSAKRLSDQTVLTGEELVIPAYPQENAEEQNQWKELWEKGVEVEYLRRVTFELQQMQDGKLVAPEEPKLSLQAGQDVLLMISSRIEELGKEYELEYAVAPGDGMFQASAEGSYLILTGIAEQPTAVPETYTVTAKYTFQDNFDQQRAVEETFSFTVSVNPVPQTKTGEFYVVFKTTQKNFQKGFPLVWQGVKVTAYEDGSFGRTLYDASAFADHTLPVEEEIEITLPEIDPNAMYTAEQILDMQKECYAIIKEQKEKLVLAEAEYKIMQRELGDGNIYADIDGKVVSLLTEDEAKQNQQPMVKVSGGGGFYIEGSVSELEKEKLKLGQEVTINDWQTGGMYTGEVVSIGDFPSDNDSWNGMGNPTASYYPFKAFVGEDADLQAGSYVSMTYSTSSAEQGIYLEKPFVRTEKGESYIYAMDANGRLEKRSVRVGKVLWGSYYEILSGLSEDDLLAFPYGKNVKPGAPAVESDLSTLYTY